MVPKLAWKSDSSALMRARGCKFCKGQFPEWIACLLITTPTPTGEQIADNWSGSALVFKRHVVCGSQREPADSTIAPFHDHRDFHTEYISAATSSSGGSSGSPIVNIRGQAIALNCGGSSAAAGAMFLRLDRVKRALDLVRGGATYVPRGDINALCGLVPAAEAMRQGVPAKLINAITAGDETEAQGAGSTAGDAGGAAASDLGRSSRAGDHRSTGLVLRVRKLLRGGHVAMADSWSADATRAWGLPPSVTGRPKWAADQCQAGLKAANNRLRAEATAAATSAASGSGSDSGLCALPTQADCFLRADDIIVRVNGELCRELCQLDAAADEALERAAAELGSSPAAKPIADSRLSRVPGSGCFPLTTARECAGGTDEAATCVNWTVERLFNPSLNSSASQEAAGPNAGSVAAALGADGGADRCGGFTVPVAALPAPPGYITLDVWRLHDTAVSESPARTSKRRDTDGSQAAKTPAERFGMTGLARGTVFRVTVPVACAYSLQPRQAVQMAMTFVQTLPLAQSYFFAIPPGTPVVSDDGFLLHGALGVYSRSQGTVRDLFRVIKSVSGPPVRTLADAVLLLLRLSGGQTFSVWLSTISHADGAPLLHSYNMARTISPCRLVSYNTAEALSQRPGTFQGWRSTPLPLTPAGYNEWGIVAWRAMVGGTTLTSAGGDLEMPVVKDADEPMVRRGTVAVGALQQNTGKRVIRALLVAAHRLATDPASGGVMLALEGAAWAGRRIWDAAANAAGPLPSSGASISTGELGGGAERETDGDEGGEESSTAHRLGGKPLRRLTAEQLAARREVLLHLRRRSRASTSTVNMSSGRSAAALSLIEVSCRPLAGVNGLRSYRNSHRSPGVGVIVDHALGLALLSAADAPTLFCDVLVGLGDTTIPGRVVTIHPEHGWALVQADIAAQPWADLVQEAVISPVGVPDVNAHARADSPDVAARFEWVGRAQLIADAIADLVLPVPWVRRWVVDALDSAAFLVSSSLAIQPFVSRRQQASSSLILGTKADASELSEQLTSSAFRDTYLFSSSRHAYSCTGFKASRLIGVEGFLIGSDCCKLRSGMVFSLQGKLRGILLPDVAKDLVLPSDYFCEPIRQIRLRMRGAPLLRGPSVASQIPDLDLRSLGATFSSMSVRDAMALYRLPADVRRRLLDASSRQKTCIIVQASSRDTWSAPPVPPGCSGGMLPGEQWSRLKDGDLLLDYLPFPAGFDDVDPSQQAPAALHSTVVAADEAERAARDADRRVTAAKSAEAGGSELSGPPESLSTALAERKAAASRFTSLLQGLQPADTAWYAPSYGGSQSPGITYRATWKRRGRINAVPFVVPVMSALAHVLTRGEEGAGRRAVEAAASAARSAIVPLTAGAALRIAGLDPVMAHPVPVMSVRELSVRAMRAPFVRFRLIRNGSVRIVRVPTWRQDLRESSAKDILVWAGILLHNADTALRREATPPTIVSPCGSHRIPCKLIAAITAPGSSGQRSLGSQPFSWVLSIDGQPTPDVAEASRVVATLADRKAVRVETASFLNGHRQALSVRLCEFTNPTERYLHAHPTFTWVTVPVRAAAADGAGRDDGAGAATGKEKLAEAEAEAGGAGPSLAATSTSQIQGVPAEAGPGPSGSDRAVVRDAPTATGEGEREDAPAPALLRVSSMTVGRASVGPAELGDSGEDSAATESTGTGFGDVRRVFLVPDSCNGSYRCVEATGQSLEAVVAAGSAFASPLVVAPAQPKSAKRSDFLFDKAFDDMGMDLLEEDQPLALEKLPDDSSEASKLRRGSNSGAIIGVESEYGSTHQIGSVRLTVAEAGAAPEGQPMSRARAKAIELAFEQAQSIMSANQQLTLTSRVCAIVGSAVTVGLAIPVWNGLRSTAAVQAVETRATAAVREWLEIAKSWSFQQR